MDHLTRVEVRTRSGRPARFDRIRVVTASGPLAEVRYSAGKTDPYVLQYRLKKALPTIRLILVDDQGEHPIDLVPGTPRHVFESTMPADDAAEDGGGGGMNPWRVLNAARQAVPAVNYALGVAGIAAAASIIVLLLGRTKLSVVLIGLVFVGMLMLFLFARMAVSESRASQLAGAFLLWSVLLFFVTFLGFTVTAFAMQWPPAWAHFLGVEVPQKQPGSADKR